LLSRGATCVYAVDVGHNQLDRKLAESPKVKNLEGRNLRELSLLDVDGVPVDFAVADVSFISLLLIIEPILSVVRKGGKALLLVKPQFELGRSALNRRGVVRDIADAYLCVDRLAEAASALGCAEAYRAQSVITGENGNTEYFLGLQL
jgi:23S rRNA (cytidine1920-2'-O)/16S rRNA (cytidine1409-2'-O)-methyltransferase